MRAVQIDEFGGPEVLKVVDLPTPEPGEGEVLVEVSTAGLNFADTHQRENSYLARFELPLVLGGEVAGTDPGGPAGGVPAALGRVRRVRRGAGGPDLRDPRRRGGRHRARARDPGPHRLAPVPHVGQAGGGRERAGGVRAPAAWATSPCSWPSRSARAA